MGKHAHDDKQREKEAALARNTQFPRKCNTTGCEFRCTYMWNYCCQRCVKNPCQHSAECAREPMPADGKAGLPPFIPQHVPPPAIQDAGTTDGTTTPHTPHRGPAPMTPAGRWFGRFDTGDSELLL